VGFAMGMERLILLLETLELVPAGVNDDADVYVTAMGEKAAIEAFRVSEMLRSALPGRTVITHCGGGSFRSQMKKADRSGAGVAVIIGEKEVSEGIVGLKYLREGGEQETVSRDRAASHLANRLGLA
jgi:histidyl-tRNA synthetase